MPLSLQFKAFVLRRKMDFLVTMVHHTCLTWPAQEQRWFLCMRVREERPLWCGVVWQSVVVVVVAVGGWITCQNRNGSAQNHFGSVFVITSPPRWMAATAARANSCLLRKIGKYKLWDRAGGRASWGESHSARESLRNITTSKGALGIRNRFLLESTSALRPISQGASKAFSKTGRIWVCTVFKY